MIEHAAYWTALMDQGKVHLFGPVFDPEEAFGMGVVCVENEDEVSELMARDPAATIGMTFRIAPMKAVLPTRD
jgi:uncharacterized protein YciI